MKVEFDFTKSGNFAVWESGSFNPQTNKGWACLVADPEGNKRQPIYERVPQHSKHHYLIRVSSGYLVIVTNIKPLNDNLYSIKIDVGRIESLSTRLAEEADKQDVEVLYEITTLATNSFLSEPTRILERAASTIDVAIANMAPEVLDRVREMMMASVEKATTKSVEQRMFWCVKRDQPAKKKVKKPQQPRSQEMEEFKKDFVALTEKIGEGLDEALNLTPDAPLVMEVPSEADMLRPQEEETEESSDEIHDGSIDPNSASLVGTIDRR